ncbi:NADH:ubiquinone oxidoreductase subunit J [Rhodobacter veldkampii DSM 11550]|uniref:NADH-quinone oxidoreductase subunit J n=1 Tax=Phaeovulum veldkampii DSM 11550 TaxID=1185920 RepID=A0A2T4JKW3_9RHOB|nr:NADH-quinone oxidoreductase subunit J [Phaeovulum veldkampii]MBK5947374.1 NADH:ubiquinone oxidoreductase subunit J [Phaeovulum veldkampii DSM 11550]PTE18549.1 NADH-quinone oxidoreductase subunit J [Phaeovulum veldkampii DSM 11550]TDQ59161.1 NADH dehydrogenase subunit J [Phaeovulum veldkampii DSM 11550]
MTAFAFTFYLFGVTAVIAGLMVVLARNPVHSVLWLILAFISSAGLFVLMGAEFVAMLLMIVYVGAVAVLFLFVVMMLDIDFAELKEDLLRHKLLGFLIGGVILGQLGFGFATWRTADAAGGLRMAPIEPGVTNTHALGMLLYDKYLLLFQVSGLVLLVAMIGAILLTIRHRRDVKRQDVLAQMYRDPAQAMELKDVKPGQGL